MLARAEMHIAEPCARSGYERHEREFRTTELKGLQFDGKPLFPCVFWKYYSASPNLIFWNADRREPTWNEANNNHTGTISDACIRVLLL